MEILPVYDFQPKRRLQQIIYNVAKCLKEPECFRSGTTRIQTSRKTKSLRMGEGGPEKGESQKSGVPNALGSFPSLCGYSFGVQRYKG